MSADAPQPIALLLLIVDDKRQPPIAGTAWLRMELGCDFPTEVKALQINGANQPDAAVLDLALNAVAFWLSDPNYKVVRVLLRVRGLDIDVDTLEAAFQEQTGIKPYHPYVPRDAEHWW